MSRRSINWARCGCSFACRNAASACLCSVVSMTTPVLTIGPPRSSKPSSPPIVNDAHLPVGTNDPILHLDRSSIHQRLGSHRLQCLSVFGMRERKKGVHRGAKRLPRGAEDAERFVGPFQTVLEEVVIPT